MTGNLLDDVKVSSAVTPTAGASGSSNINGTVLDMSGYRGVVALVHFGAITAGAATSLKMQQDTVVGFGGGADLAGSGITVIDTADDTIYAIDLANPLEQFVRLVILRATQASTVCALYLQYRGRSRPAIAAAVLTATKKLISPAEGTP